MKSATTTYGNKFGRLYVAFRTCDRVHADRSSLPMVGRMAVAARSASLVRRFTSGGSFRIPPSRVTSRDGPRECLLGRHPEALGIVLVPGNSPAAARLDRLIRTSCVGLAFVR
jgi:hypothetical protein